MLYPFPLELSSHIFFVFLELQRKVFFLIGQASPPLLEALTEKNWPEKTPI